MSERISRHARRILVPAVALGLVACGSDTGMSQTSAALGGGNCYGGVGPNCNGAPKAACTLEDATNTYSCQISVGSEMHDTCCGQHHHGFNCGSPFTPFECVVPPGGTKPACCDEWNHAFNDTALGRQFSARFKGDDSSVPGPLANLTGGSVASPTRFAYLVRGGTRLWAEDATRGWCKFGWNTGGPGEAVCKEGPPLSFNPCQGAPSHAAFCGNDRRYGFAAHVPAGSTDPNTLYFCDVDRVDHTAACANGCTLGKGAANDSCAALPALHCPTNGLYCGSDGVGGDPKTLYRCTNGTAEAVQVCPNGCQTNPPGQDDACVSARCPSGDGLYCGTIAGQDPDSLYRCNAGAYSFVGVCANGCQVNPPGQNDACKSDSGSGTCPSGNGLYCGGNGVSGDANTLYQCTNGALSVAQACANGCRRMPPGTNDACEAAPAPGSCPSGNGLYCGAIAGQDPDSLYQCNAGVFSFVGVCGSGCQTMPPGTNDQCYAATCPSGNGLYCGGDSVSGDPKTLYRCTNGALSVVQVCANGCRVMPPGQNDQCG